MNAGQAAASLTGIFVGATLCIIGFYLVKGVRAAWGMMRDIATGLKSAQEHSTRLVAAAEGIQQELAFQRGLALQAQAVATQGMQVGGDPEEQAGDEADPDPNAELARYMEERARAMRVRPPFPSTNYDRLRQEPFDPAHGIDHGKPDAEVGDTDRSLLEQTDEQLMEAETLEGMRERGMDVEDHDAVHPGIVKEA